MAERRMFARSVIGSARFLRMPATSRLLYYDLGMEADDDGCVEAFGVMRKTGATEDDLRVLASKGFVRVLNEDFVSYILDWNTNNQIRRDRYHEGIYKGLINGSCNVILGTGNQSETICQPTDNQMATEVSIGKSSIVKDSLVSVADKPPAPAKQARKSYGEFGWVKLTDDEYNRLLNDLGEAEVKRCIA
ncbi:MAG: replisome organizer, partial [Candidatus Faecousia sp.]|nr:replisome organizer [Candidatus Faecousia sp.]